MAMDNVEDIKSIDELRKAQAAAQAQGSNITNYSQWEQILEDFDTAGIQSTGTFDGDVKLHSEVMAKIENYIEQVHFHSLPLLYTILMFLSNLVLHLHLFYTYLLKQIEHLHSLAQQLQGTIF